MLILSDYHAYCIFITLYMYSYVNNVAYNVHANFCFIHCLRQQLEQIIQSNLS